MFTISTLNDDDQQIVFGALDFHGLGTASAKSARSALVESRDLTDDELAAALTAVGAALDNAHTLAVAKSMAEVRRRLAAGK